MFKKENRLVPGTRFDKSHVFTVPQFVLKEQGNLLGVNRFGIVVSKRTDKRAVVRNKVKGFFRTAFMNLGKTMNAGHDILVVTKKEILNGTSEENLLVIESVLKKAGIIKK